MSKPTEYDNPAAVRFLDSLAAQPALTTQDFAAVAMVAADQAGLSLEGQRILRCLLGVEVSS